MSQEQDISNIYAKLTQMEGTIRQMSDDQYVGNLDIESIDNKTPTQGQTTMANSSPVVLASNQSAIPITGSITAVNDSVGPNNAAIPLESTQVGGSDGTNLRSVSVDSTGKLNINNISGTVSLPTGAATAANQASEVVSLTSIDAKLNTLGQKSMSASVPVVIASNQTAIPVTGSFTDPSIGLNGAPIPTSSTQVGGTDGTNLRPISVDTTGKVNVNVTGVVPLPSGASTDATLTGGTQQTKIVDAGGVNIATVSAAGAVKVDGSAVTQPVSFPGGLTVQGDVANDIADTGNPVKVGGVARTSNPTAVTTGDRVNAMYDKLGRQVVSIATVREKIDHQTTTITTTAETPITTSVAEFQDLTSIFISNTSATGVTIDIRSATAGAVRLSLYSPAQSSIVYPFSPPFPQVASGNNWTAQLSAAVTDVRIFTENIRNL